MTLTPMFNVKNAKQIPAEQKVPYLAIKGIHNARWNYECSLGKIRLRRLNFLDQEATSLRLRKEHPEYYELVAQISPLWELMGRKVALDPEQKALRDTLTDKLQPYAHEFSAACFVDVDENGEEFGVFKNGRELCEFLFELRTEEQRELMDILAELGSASLDGRVETIGLILAKEYGLKIADDLTMENMTSVQATVLAQALNDSRNG